MVARDDARTQARKLLITALGATPGEGVTEAVLRRTTNVSHSLFHEVMPDLLGEGLVVISHGNGRKVVTEYHLVTPVQTELAIQEGPITPLAESLLLYLRDRAEGVRSLAQRFEVDVTVVEVTLNDLTARGLVTRRQVGMLVIYRAVASSETKRK